jgi:hypothetical protein
MNEHDLDLDRLVDSAGLLTSAQLGRFSSWADQPRAHEDAMWSDRQMALSSAQDQAMAAGRQKLLLDAMDRAYGAVARSAGHTTPISYFADDRGERSSWEAAARVAAETAAAIVSRDLLHPTMFDLLMDPWKRYGFDPSSGDIRGR